MTELEFGLLVAWGVTFALYISKDIDYKHERRMAGMMMIALKEIAEGKAEVSLNSDGDLRIKHKD